MKNKYIFNKCIEEMADVYVEGESRKDFYELAAVIEKCIMAKCVVPTPMADRDGKFEFPAEEDGSMNLTIDTIQGKGHVYFPLFTDKEQMEWAAVSPMVVDCPIENLLKCAYLDPRIEGVIINPFTQAVVINEHYLEMILESAERQHNKGRIR